MIWGTQDFIEQVVNLEFWSMIVLTSGLDQKCHMPVPSKSSPYVTKYGAYRQKGHQKCAFQWHLSTLQLQLTTTTRLYCICNNIVLYSTVIKKLRICSEMYCNHNVLNANHNLGQPCTPVLQQGIELIVYAATGTVQGNI